MVAAGKESGTKPGRRWMDQGMGKKTRKQRLPEKQSVGSNTKKKKKVRGFEKRPEVDE